MEDESPREAGTDGEGWHQAILDQLQAYVYVKDLQGRYVFVNDWSCRFVGRPREEIIGRTNHELLAPEVARVLDASDRRAIEEGQPIGYELEMVPPGGTQRGCFWTVKQPLRDAQGRVIGVCGVSTDITGRKQQEQELLALKNQREATLRAMPDLMFELDAEARFVDYHSPREELLVQTPDQFLGRTVAEALPPAVAEICLDAMRQAREYGYASGQQFWLDLPIGRHWFELSVAVRDTANPASGGYVVLSRDITDRKRAEQALQQSESLLRAVVDNTPLQYWARDREGRCIMENAQVVKHWGSLLGTRPQDADISPQELAHWLDNNRRAMEGEVVEGEVMYVVDGEPRNFLNVVAPIRVDGDIIGTVGYNQDITERKAAEESIRNMAFYDALTGLPNRRLMFDRLGHALVGSARRKRQGALLLIDLDNFKQLNDTQGHDAGDQLLLEVAARLHASIRHGDTAARLGGDEFVVIFEDIDGHGGGALQAEMLAQQILQRLSQSYQLKTAQGGAFTYHCTSSIGITLFGGNDVTAEELLRCSDTAMYQAKAAGRNTLRFFDPQMQQVVAARAALEADLRRSLTQGHFVLYVQPQVDAAERITGAEVLLRWQHPERGLVLPGEFIGLAEETSLVVPLGHWILEQACEVLAAWARDPLLADLTLSVNVSARQLHQPLFVEQLRSLFAASGALPQRLKLELTESVLLEHNETVIGRLLELRDLGLGFSLDDFGTGYSSLVYLKRLPIDQLKIDQSFVRDVLTDPNDAVIARTIVALADSLGLGVIAEGVETEGQRDFLAQNGCRAYQGYLYGRPMGLDDFRTAVHAQGREPAGAAV